MEAAVAVAGVRVVVMCAIVLENYRRMLVVGFWMDSILATG